MTLVPETRRRPPETPLPDGSSKRKRVLVVPAYNEEARLGGVLRGVEDSRLGVEVVVVDDGSRDRTAGVGRQAGARVLRHPFNLGYGAALQTGYKYAFRAGATVVAQLDADGQHDPEQLGPLIEMVEAGTADLVIGSRFLGERRYRMGFARSIGRRLFQVVARASGLRITDPTSGFQVMNREVLRLFVNDLFPTDYPDLDVLIVARQMGLRIAELPVSMAPSPRQSSLHSGLAPVYYLYRMALSLWSGTSGYRKENDP